MKTFVGKHKKRIVIGLSIVLLLGGIGLALRFNLIYSEAYVKMMAKVEKVDSWEEKTTPVRLYQVHGTYGFMNDKKEIIQKPFMKELYAFNQQGIAVYQDHLSKRWGFVNDQGKIVHSAFMNNVHVWQPETHSFYEANNTHFSKAPSLYFFKDQQSKKYGLIDGNGQLIKKPTMESYESFSPNGLVFPYAVKKDKKILYGLMDQHGKTVVEPFATSLKFSFDSDDRNIATYQLEKNGKVGLMDWTGKILAKPFAAEINLNRLNNELVQYKEEKNGLSGLAKMDGTILKRPFAKYIYLKDDKKMATFSIDKGKNSIYGTFDPITGDIMQEAFAVTIEEMNDQLAYYMTENNGAKGLLSADGKILKKAFTRFFGWREEKELESDSTDPEENLFDENGLTCFEDLQTGLLGLMDKNGTIVKEPFAAYINHYSDGLAVFLQKDKETDQFLYGFMDQKGNIVKEAFATAMSSFNNGVAWFEDPMSGKGGLINKQGQIIRKPFAFGGTQFTDSGIATFSLTDNGKKGIINQEGVILKNPFAFELSSINRSYEVYKYKENEPDLYGLIDRQGTIIQEPFAYQIESATPQKGPQKLVAFTKSENGLWGILNDQGKIVKEPFAYTIIPFTGTQDILGFRLEEDGPIGLIDQTGTIIRPPSLTFIEALKSDKNQPLRYVYEERETHLEGIMDEQFQPITEPFAATIAFDEGGFSRERLATTAMPYKVYTEESGPNNHGLIALDGKILQQPFATKIESFNEDGIASFLYDERGISKSGLVNEQGVILEK